MVYQEWNDNNCAGCPKCESTNWFVSKAWIGTGWKNDRFATCDRCDYSFEEDEFVELAA